jgi:hypothetical protein
MRILRVRIPNNTFEKGLIIDFLWMMLWVPTRVKVSGSSWIEAGLGQVSSVQKRKGKVRKRNLPFKKGPDVVTTQTYYNL